MAIGLAGVIRFLLVIAAVVAVVAALDAGRTAMAVGGLAFLAIAAWLGLRARRAQLPPPGSS